MFRASLCPSSGALDRIKVYMVSALDVLQSTCRIIRSSELLKMDIIMPETCWANGLLINHNCCICLVSHDISRHFIFTEYVKFTMRRLFWPRRDEVTGEWKRLHNEELNDLYSSPNIVRVIKSKIMRWAGHMARMGEEWGVYRFLLGKPEGRSPLGRPRRR